VNEILQQSIIHAVHLLQKRLRRLKQESAQRHADQGSFADRSGIGRCRWNVRMTRSPKLRGISAQVTAILFMPVW
jgi:hypothetical protein